MQKRNDEKKNLHIQCAFKSDCEKLLGDYATLCDLSYVAFAKVWTDMSFSLIFSGKSSYEELRHFTESCFFTAKKFLIFSKDLYVRVGALYLLYGLYYKQPLKDFVKIRLTKPEYATLLELTRELQTRKQLDALYIFTKMKCDDVFDHVYTQTLMAPDLSQYTEIFTMKDDLFQFKVVNEIEAQLRDVVENDDVRKMGAEYRKAVREYAATSGEASLVTFDTDILDELHSILKEAVGETDFVEQDDGDAAVDVKLKKKQTINDEISVRRRNIKAKASGAMQNKSRKCARKK